MTLAEVAVVGRVIWGVDRSVGGVGGVLFYCCDMVLSSVRCGVWRRMLRCSVLLCRVR